MRKASAALLLALGVARVGAAQESAVLPGITPEQRQEFRLCRAAVFYHLDRDAAPGRMVPREVAEAMNEQIAFVMAETLRSAPAGSMADNRRLIDFSESFFLAFSRTIAEQRALGQDPERREALLIDCVPLVWAVARARIDRLLAFREGSRRAPSEALPGSGR